MIDVLLVYTDGASVKPSTSHAGIGIVFYDDQGTELAKHSEYVGERTCNEAEYMAVIRALELAPAHCRRKVIIHSDSELIVRQLNKIYCIKTPHLLPLERQIRAAEPTFEAVEYRHVPREAERLRVADGLSREAIADRAKH